MKITKRQLKRIIKEEYSRLKKQGLIQEQAIDVEAILHDTIRNSYIDELVENLVQAIERNGLDPYESMNIISATGALTPDQYDDIEDLLGTGEELAWDDSEPEDFRPLF